MNNFIEQATKYNKMFSDNYIKRWKDYENDIKKDYREKKHLCRECCYLKSWIGGAVMTTSKCELCGREIINTSTNTDKVCVKCAKELNICRHCGGKK